MTQRKFPDDDNWHADMDYAFEEAACAIESTEYAGGNTQHAQDRQHAAFQEVARMIRQMANRYMKRKRGNT